MQKAKLNILFAQFAYAGNGGVATVLPEYVPWFAKVYSLLSRDERVGQVGIRTFGDIPLDIERNRVILEAKKGGFDVVVMLDSDNIPDLYLNHGRGAKPFITTSFDFLYERELRGVPTVVCAPYCGPPPHPVKGGSENVYVFYATHDEGDEGSPDKVNNVRFEAYSREHAAIMRGIQPCAAGPTGCIMYSMSAFDLMPVSDMTQDEIMDQFAAGKISKTRAMQLLNMESWFYYESPDKLRTSKASTEDVTNTREINFAGLVKHGEPIVFCNWDSWAGHMKPKCVGAPMPLKIENVSNLFREAVSQNISQDEVAVEIDFTSGDPLPGPRSTPSRLGLDVVDSDGSSDYIPSNDGESLKPVSVKRELRLGVPVEHPRWSEKTLLGVRAIVSQEARQHEVRVLILGDITGELSHAAAANDKITAYTDGKVLSPDNVSIRTVPRFDVNAMQPQDLDFIVDVPGASSSDLADQFIRHIRPGGTLIYLTTFPTDETGYETSLLLDDMNVAHEAVEDSTIGITAITKKHKAEEPDGPTEV